ncbi:class I SAM-dependent methyltransferase [Azospirillum thermophilum]|uniref:SAM-dependent methyltransferase n=1 Tax=Azospirillum thermophilum TaxID=2202148 RepID=A0A2S2CP80_9PROT|nr:class I SAM-dependent methyltransferase [Azospirillum thermophilum]AWK86311.1 SAM-dependent methyltransferase [Azospirillum thermophilum]
MSFKDHFSGHAGEYRAWRPDYPDALPAFLAGAAPSRGLAWDVGCGNGQLSVALARHFARVVATDASAGQIAEAEPYPNIRYAAAPAEAGGLEDRSCDLIVAAQAAHWFDLDRFYAEVRRAARPGGAVALVSYGLNQFGDPAIDSLLRELHDVTLRSHWPADRWHVVNGYRDLPFPFDPLPVPPLAMEARWSLPRFLGYLGTWSGVKRAIQATGRNPLEPAAEALAPLWGDPQAERTVRWPLTVRLGRVF